MKRLTLILFCFSVSALLPSLSLAGCHDLGGFNNFALEGNNTVILYSRSTPIGKFDVQDCAVQPNSRILLLNSMVCDGDSVQIDGSKCTVMDVTPLN
jgi:hypothetical protein